jgi:hypothetical protein
VGIVGTPAIDTNTNTLYVVAKTYENGVQILRLHALDLVSSGEKFGAPVQIFAAYPGTGDASINNLVCFDSHYANQRPGLTLASGNVYLSFASHGDQAPYHGWVLAYNAGSLQQNVGSNVCTQNQQVPLPIAVFNTSPNDGGAGIWMSGQAPVVDSSGNLYALTGNLKTLLVTTASNCLGGFGGNEAALSTYGESYLKLSGSQLTLLDYYKPSDAATLDCEDADFSSGGAMEIPGSGFIVAGGKDGNLVLLNENGMGSNPPAETAAQIFSVASSPIFSSPVWWNNNIYLWGSSDVLKSWSWNSTSSSFNTTPLSAPGGIRTPVGYSSNGQLSISSNGMQAGIVWGLVPQTNPNDYPAGGDPGTLYAFDAASLSQLLITPIAYGNYSKYVPSTIANGKVFVPTNSGQVAVYGLVKPAAYLGCYTDSSTRALPSFLSGTGETVESCRQKAAIAGLPYAGVQFFGQCFAGNTPGFTRIPDGQCNTLCSNNQNEVCGGAWHNSIYQSETAPPTPVSASPSSGSGSSQTFTATYADPLSGAAIDIATFYFSSAVPGTSGWAASQCLLRYDPGPRNLYLVNDAGTGWMGPIVAGGGGTLSNSQCTYYASGASASVSGNTLTATFQVVFNTSTFSGSKPIYLEAHNVGGWSTNLGQQFGSWTIPFQALPSPVSVTPSSGNGLSQTFTATYTDSLGGSNITEAVFHIMSNTVPGTASGWSANECIVRFDPGSNNLYVVVDGGGGWSAPTVAGGGGVASNSQCMVIGSGSSGVVSGNTLTVNFHISFSGSNFSGGKQLYMTAGNSTGFDTNFQHQFGSWTVPSQPPIPSLVGVTPSSGSGASQQFTATFTDPNGGGDISETNLYVMNNVVPGTVSGWSGHECIARYDPPTNNLYLVIDAGGSWSAPTPAGGSGAVSNSQCTLFGAGSSASISGNTLTVTFNISFNTGTFAGAKQLFLTAGNSVGFTGNFQHQFGIWNVP